MTTTTTKQNTEAKTRKYLRLLSAVEEQQRWIESCEANGLSYADGARGRKIREADEAELAKRQKRLDEAIQQFQPKKAAPYHVWSHRMTTFCGLPPADRDINLNTGMARRRPTTPTTMCAECQAKLLRLARRGDQENEIRMASFDRGRYNGLTDPTLRATLKDLVATVQLVRRDIMTSAWSTDTANRERHAALLLNAADDCLDRTGKRLASLEVITGL